MTEDYTGLAATVISAVSRRPGHFAIEDTGGSYMLNHVSIPLTIELPERLEVGQTSHVNLMAPLAGGESPEEMVDSLTSLASNRDLLLEKGYAIPEKVEWYDDGAEYVFKVATESEGDLVKIVEDFSGLGDGK